MTDTEETQPTADKKVWIEPVLAVLTIDETENGGAGSNDGSSTQS